MSNSVAGAILLLAGAQLSAPMESVEPFEVKQQHYAQDAIVTGRAASVLYALAGGVAAASLYRMTDESFEYYPLQADFSGRGTGFDNPLSMRRGGLRFSFTAVRRAKTQSVSHMPDYRKEARNMAKAMPGYPQPARIVVGLKVNY